MTSKAKVPALVFGTILTNLIFDEPMAACVFFICKLSTFHSRGKLLRENPSSDRYLYSPLRGSNFLQFYSARKEEARNRYVKYLVCSVQRF
jgi:hypothetical protein